MQDEKQDQTQEKPDIYFMEKSPLLRKAELFTKMLQEDQERIDKLVSEGRQDEVSIEEIDENDTAVIEMNVIPGFLESKTLCPEVLPPDTTEFSNETWQKATEETQKE